MLSIPHLIISHFELVRLCGAIDESYMENKFGNDLDF